MKREFIPHSYEKMISRERKTGTDLNRSIDSVTFVLFDERQRIDEQGGRRNENNFGQVHRAIAKVETRGISPNAKRNVRR